MELWQPAGAGELMLPDFRLQCFILTTAISRIKGLFFASSAYRREEEKSEKCLYSSIKFV